MSLTARADVVPLAYRVIGAAVGVPPDVLYAVALQESRLALGVDLQRPWPWTLNVAGTPLRFRTANETLETLEARLEAGTRNVDIGVMQVNWRWHGHRFGSPKEAIDPYRNIRTGARILREEFDRCDRDWWCAVGRYHSYRPGTAARYSQSVQSVWADLHDG